MTNQSTSQLEGINTFFKFIAPNAIFERCYIKDRIYEIDLFLENALFVARVDNLKAVPQLDHLYFELNEVIDYALLLENQNIKWFRMHRFVPFFVKVRNAMTLFPNCIVGIK